MTSGMGGKDVLTLWLLFNFDFIQDSLQPVNISDARDEAPTLYFEFWYSMTLTPV